MTNKLTNRIFQSLYFQGQRPSLDLGVVLLAALYFSVAWMLKYDDPYRDPILNNMDHRIGVTNYSNLGGDPALYQRFYKGKDVLWS